MEPAGQPTEQKMAKALKEYVFAAEHNVSRNNVNNAANGQRAAEQARLEQVKEEIELP